MQLPLHMPGKPANDQTKPAACCCQPAGDCVRSADLGLTLLGALGWLALPKCPLCLAAYVAIGSGLSLSAGASQKLYLGLATIAAVLFLAGLYRMRKTLPRRRVSFWR